MKTILFLALSLLLQSPLQQIMDFYMNADKEYYVSLAKANTKEAIVRHWSSFIPDAPYDTIQFLIPPPDTAGLFQEQKIIPLLCVEFKDMDEFGENDDVYSHLVIDSMIVFVLAGVDERMRIVNLYHFPDSYLGMGRLDEKHNLRNIFSSYMRRHMKARRRMRNSLHRVLREKPEALLLCPRLGGGGGLSLSCYIDFIYIKAGKAFLYRSSKKKIYELNEYARNLVKKTGALDRWSRLGVPIIYLSDPGKLESRRAGYTPKEYNLILQAEGR